MRQNKYEYDAFISHAVEDKIPIANELCAKLERAGLRIWYSGKELGVGDSIEKTIERGLNRSRYGIVIFSPTYLAKNWTIREFYTLLAKEIEEQKVILPVLYNITLDELKNKDLVMADRFAVNADRGIDFVVDRLVAEIKKSHTVERKVAWFSKIWLVLILSLIANVTLLLKGNLFSESTGNDVSLSLQQIEPQSSQINPGMLLGEMHGLLTRMSTCNCDGARDSDPAFVYNAGFSQSHQNVAPTESFDGPGDASQNDEVRRAGNKVTMAVVFQIEMPDLAPPGIEHEMDQIFQTISLREKEDRVVRVANLDSRVNANNSCLHGHRTD